MNDRIRIASEQLAAMVGEGWIAKGSLHQGPPLALALADALLTAAGEREPESLPDSLGERVIVLDAAIPAGLMQQIMRVIEAERRDARAWRRAAIRAGAVAVDGDSSAAGEQKPKSAADADGMMMACASCDDALARAEAAEAEKAEAISEATIERNRRQTVERRLQEAETKLEALRVAAGEWSHELSGDITQDEVLCTAFNAAFGKGGW